VTLSPEDLANLAETYANERLNASNEEDTEAAEIMCELIRLAQLGAALSTNGGNPAYFDVGCGGANGSH
jgi:hypothetical protein